MFAVVDCNNFFASCERVFNPKMEGRPVVVLSNNDGCVIARSNESKALGIKMGEPAFLIKDFLAKHKVAVFSSNYALYGDLSERVMKTICQMAPDVEIYSIDEAFIDLASLKYRDVFSFCQEIRSTVVRWTGIPVSIGIASTKTLAKVANRIAKKSKEANGVFMFSDDEQVKSSLKSLDVEDIWGVGRQYGKFLKNHSIYTALDLMNANEIWVKKNMTVMGLRTVKELKGISCIPLELAVPDKKGILTSRSFGTPVEDLNNLREAVATFTVRCAEKLRHQHSCANMLMVFIRTDRFKPTAPQYKNFKLMNLPVPTNNSLEMVKYSLQGLDMIFKPGYKYKKAGVFITGIVPDSQVQSSLFDNVDRQKQEKAIKAVDQINSTMGRDKVRLAVQGFDRKWRLREEQLSPCYTSLWSDILEIKI